MTENKTLQFGIEILFNEFPLFYTNKNIWAHILDTKKKKKKKKLHVWNTEISNLGSICLFNLYMLNHIHLI